MESELAQPRSPTFQELLDKISNLCDTSINELKHSSIKTKTDAIKSKFKYD